MPTIRIQGMEGEVPRLSSRLLQNQQAQKAIDCDLASGEVRALETNLAVEQPAKAGTIQTIHRMGDPDSTYWWLHWTEDVDVARGPGAVNNRVYYTVNDGATTPPRVTDDTLVDASGDTYPTDSYRLGVPAPTNTPSAALSGAGTGNPVSTAYVYTFVTGWDEEGPPSDPSNVVAVEDGQTVDLSNLGGAPAGDYNITHQRIYRVEGETGAYLFVDEIAIADTTYNDSVASDDLGEAIPSTGWDPPPDDLFGLVALPNGVFAGISGNYIYFSEPYQPHAWPTAYRQLVNLPPVALGSFGTTVVVATEGAPYTIQGSHPANMVMQRVPDVQPCIAKRGVVSTAAGVLYPTQEGVYRVGPDGYGLATAGLYSFQEWQALRPQTLLHAAYHDGRYLAFFDFENDGRIIPVLRENERVSRISYKATALYADPRDGELYLVREVEEQTYIMRWRGAGAPSTYTWRSKLLDTPPLNFVAGMVKADHDRWAALSGGGTGIENPPTQDGSLGGAPLNTFPINGDAVTRNATTEIDGTLLFRLFANGTEKFIKTVTSDEPFRLPAGFIADDVEIEVSGNVPVREIALGTSMGELT